MRRPKTETLYIRISPDIKAALQERAEAEDLTTSDVVRQLVTGLVEGRVTIIPPTDRKESNVSRIQD